MIRHKTTWTQWPDVPSEVLQLAKDRTAFLLEKHPLTIQTLPVSLANAYLQGLADAAETAAGVMHRDFTPKRDTANAPEGLA
jgi:hypothetical protein